MKNNRANSFDDFIIEAYIDPEGELQDFSLSQEDELKIDADAQIKAIKDSLRLDGANEIKVKAKNDFSRVSFYFEYSGENYMLSLNIDHNFSIVVKLKSGRAPDLIYTGSSDTLFDMLGSSGLYGLLGY